ncbi:tail-specific protease [Alcanivorax sp. VBW004]|jgi:carboxyl-terminal processing protease|uniref:carboxy terminal-processing peptidase n=1 Tax=unclassified Alcanivorax TaxID=2638842 RepID=UPI00017EBD79|nr:MULTISPECIES: carboxy terminal-processing peptidase [unclassified Alcanivorax]EDX89819.1 C-terminal processing peptidase subfamily, putative [Alcanivorax sp. DG881]MTT53606.1 tail-specific protease [Alcanivorax sp. VBW004]
MSLLRKLFPLALALLLLGGAIKGGGALHDSSPDIQGDLKPTEEQLEAAEEIADKLKYHYRQLDFDDQLSEQVLQRYLKDLDPNRLYFLASDIKDFQRYNEILDDQLRKGQLEGGYTIFNRFQQRLEERLTWSLETIANDLDSLTFDSEESVRVDREDAPWAKDKAALDEIWQRQLKNAVLSMRLNDSSAEDIETRLTRRYESQLKRIKQNTPEDVFQVYMNALTQTFDPHTTYFTPHNSKNFDISMSRSLEGIGAVLQYEDGYTKVVRLVPGGPAAKGGQLKPADRIVGVSQDEEDPVPVIGLRLDEVVDQIRGPKGTKVNLEIIPAGSPSEHDTRTITIVRNKVVLEEQAAKKDIIHVDRNGQDLKLGIIEIPAFYLDFDAYHRGDPKYTSTTSDVAKLLVELRKENIDGLVIDLRNNGGGSLLEVNKLVSLFINRGPTVQVRESNGRVSVEGDKFPGVLFAGPMAVMVNRYSASASEIFAGAMQDYGRALIVGDQTYGKGTVQTLLDLNHGKLKMTNAKFYRVSGSSNQNLGIVPDVDLPSLVDKDDVGESSLPNALPWDEIKSANFQRVTDLVPFLPQLRERHEERTDSDPEFVYVHSLRKLLDVNRNRTELSLNEKARTQMQTEFDKERLAIENSRRQARDEDPLESIKELRTLEEQRALDPESHDEAMDEDPYVRETGEILVDYMDLLRENQVARKG